MREWGMFPAPDLVEVATGGRHRVLVTDSVWYAAGASTGDVVVSGSHGGLQAARYARLLGLSCLACHDAGIGKNEAGVAGLRALDAAGVAGVAVGHRSARIGDGADCWAGGVITYANDTARRAGMVPGEMLHRAVREGTFPWRSAPSRRLGQGGPGGSRNVIHEGHGRTVTVMDATAWVAPEDRDQVIVVASSGEAASAAAVRGIRAALAVFNDAGIGKDCAGVEGVHALDLDEIPAAAAGHMTAEIGNGSDTWENGVLTVVNAAAARAGLTAGTPVKDAVLAFLASSGA